MHWNECGRRAVSCGTESAVPEEVADRWNAFLFWCKVTNIANSLRVEEATLSHWHKVPKRYEDGCVQAIYPTTIEEHYHQIYYKTFGLTINSISDCLNWHGYCIYHQVEQLLLKVAKKEVYDEKFSFVTNFYESIFDARILSLHLELFTSCNISPPKSLKDVIVCLKDSSLEKRAQFLEAVKLVKLVLVMPATNSCHEHSFSALQLIQTYLPSTMRQDWKVYLMLLYVHMELKDDLDLTLPIPSILNPHTGRSCLENLHPQKCRSCITGVYHFQMFHAIIHMP